MAAVAYFQVEDLYSDNSSNIQVYANDRFYLGRHPGSCRFSWAESAISNKHVRIHCVVFDDQVADPLPLVYVEDFSTNGTVLTTSHGTGPSTLFLHGSKTGAVLLNHGDELLLSGVVNLTFIENHPRKSEAWDPVRQVEKTLFQDKYYITERKLGVGGQGSVYVAIEKSSSRQFACKVIQLRQKNEALDARAESKIRRAFREFNVLKDISHPNIIGVEKVFWSINSIYIFQDLITGGDLFSYIEFKGGRLNEPEAATIVRQILKAIEYLHSQGFVHRDLKPDNILVTSLEEGARIIITDFGSARSIPKANSNKKISRSRMFTLVGTTEFVAPEVHARNPKIAGDEGYSEAADMWSIGCITTALLSGDVLFIDRTGSAVQRDAQEHIISRAAACDLRVLDIGPVWQDVGEQPKSLLRGLLTLEEKQRLTATQALAHPWFTNETYAAELEAVYQRAIQSWKPRRKIFRLVEHLQVSGGDPTVRSTYFKHPVVSRAPKSHIQGDEGVPLTEDEAVGHARARHADIARQRSRLETRLDSLQVANNDDVDEYIIPETPIAAHKRRRASTAARDTIPRTAIWRDI